MAWELRVGQATPQGSAQAPALSGKPLVAILIPHTRHANLEWVNKSYIPIIGVPHAAFDKIHQLSSGIPLPNSREQMVDAVLKDPRVTHIFFLDTDMLPEGKDMNDIVAMLLSTNNPIACGLYRARKAEGFFYATWSWGKDASGKEGYVPIAQWSGNWFPCEVTGLGCALIKREVFEKTPKPWFLWDMPENSPSEDFAFFRKASGWSDATKTHSNPNYRPWILAEAKMSHIGELVVETDGKVRALQI